MNRACLVFCALCVASALLGAVTLPGADAARGLRGWWSARAYEQAALDLDWAQMARLGTRLLVETHDGRPLQLAASRMGMDGTARTQGRVDADILSWAGLATALLDEAALDLPDPWAAEFLQAFMLVERVYPVTGDPADLARGLAALERWMAAGGGLRAPGGATGRSYRALLSLAPEQRAAALQDFLVPR